MKKLNHWLQNYLFYTFPCVVAVAIWGTVASEEQITQNPSLFVKGLWQVLSWNIMLWVALLIVFLILLVLVPSTRDQVLKRMANIKERDEREVYITGMASKKAMISTLSILIFLFFISAFKINITKLPPEQVTSGKHGSVTLGFGFSLLDEPKTKTDAKSGVVFESNDLPLSKSSILILIIVWQLFSFNYSSRKLMKENL